MIAPGPSGSNGSLAQLEERLVVNQNVGGSSPPGVATKFFALVVNQTCKNGLQVGRGKRGEDMAKRKSNNPTAKPKFETAEALQEKIDAYFEHCEVAGEVPEEFGMGVFLGVTVHTLDNWYSGITCPYLQDTVQMAYMRMSAAAVQMAYHNPKMPMPLFALKQKRYGGYQDKVESNAKIEVNVKMGKNMEADDFA